MYSEASLKKVLPNIAFFFLFFLGNNIAFCMLWRICCDHCGHEIIELLEQGVEERHRGADHG